MSKGFGETAANVARGTKRAVSAQKEPLKALKRRGEMRVKQN